MKLPRQNKKQNYSLMAKYYDDILSYIDYDKWYESLGKIVKKNKIKLDSVLDISCGLGKYVIHMLDKGINIKGSDLSTTFINTVKSRVKTEYKRKFWVDDMRETTRQSASKYTFIVSLHDSVNYLTTKRDFTRFIKNTHKLLKKDGILLFDLSTEYNVTEYFEDITISDEIGNLTYFWSSEYNHNTKIIVSKIDFIERNDDNTYNVSYEVHKQKIWEEESIIKVVKDYYDIVDICDNISLKKTNNKSKGINYILRKK